MDKKKTLVAFVAMILNCICAIAWNINVFIDFAYRFPNILHIICAIVWDCCAALWVVRYLKTKNNSDGQVI